MSQRDTNHRQNLIRSLAVVWVSRNRPDLWAKFRKIALKKYPSSPRKVVASKNRLERLKMIKGLK